MNARQVKCPRCGKLTLFTPENANRPFCSERCKLIDLGAWAEEKYRVPVAPAPDADSEINEDENSGEQSGNDTRGASSGDGPPLH